MNCYTCHQPITIYGCGCSSNDCCTTTPQVDAAQVIYHKSNGDLSALNTIDLLNGSTLELIVETIDAKIAPLNVLSTTLTYLRTKYVISNLTQFLVAVSTELGLLSTQILAGATWTTAARPESPIEGQDGFNLTTSQREYWSGAAWISY